MGKPARSILGGDQSSAWQIASSSASRVRAEARRKADFSRENIMTIRPIQSQLIVHQEQPLNAEPPGDLLRQSFLTPQQHFFIRTHGSIPAVDPASYRLLLTGM